MTNLIKIEVQQETDTTREIIFDTEPVIDKICVWLNNAVHRYRMNNPPRDPE